MSVLMLGDHRLRSTKWILAHMPQEGDRIRAERMREQLMSSASRLRSDYERTEKTIVTLEQSLNEMVEDEC